MEVGLEHLPLAGYFAIIAGLLAVLLQSQQSQPAATRRASPTSSLFGLLALVSLAFTWTYMFKYFAWSRAAAGEYSDELPAVVADAAASLSHTRRACFRVNQAMASHHLPVRGSLEQGLRYARSLVVERAALRVDCRPPYDPLRCRGQASASMSVRHRPLTTRIRRQAQRN